jgi:23S rRNA (adenine2503-C2)-methyltransferase
MVAQVLAVADVALPLKTTKPVLFSAMGEGEPLLGSAAGLALVEAFQQLSRRHGSRIAVSTTAIKPAVVRWLADAAPDGLKLQISLHGSTDEQRRQVIPHAAPIDDVVAAGRAFAHARHGGLEWNYVLIAELNDNDEDAERLGRLLASGDTVKLNKLNPIPGSPWRASERSLRFAALLRDAGIRPEHYRTDGADVAAACGQLKSRVTQLRLRDPRYATSAARGLGECDAK